MTCICWDGKELVADRQGDRGGTRTRVRKLRRVVKEGKVCLIGVSGHMDAGEQWMDWFEGKTSEKPTFDKDDTLTALIVERRRIMVVSAPRLYPHRVFERKFAIGSGRGEAMGAMLMGASARTAVRVASRLDTGVGCGIDVVCF